MNFKKNMRIRRFIPYCLSLYTNILLWLLVIGYVYPQTKLREKIYKYSKEIEKVRDMRFFIVPKLLPISRKDLRKLADDFLKHDNYVNTILPIYKKLGLIEKDVTLKKIKSLMKKVFLEQITAFFSPNQNSIYFNTHNIIKPLPDFRFSEKIGLTPMESIFVHELVHALDYHNFSSRFNVSRSYVDDNVSKIINEGSAMFSLFLYASGKVNKNPMKFIRDNMQYLPLHYEGTGYKSFDRLPEIIRYDLTLPYSLGPRLFYRLYKQDGLKAFKNIFSEKFCSLVDLVQYVYNSHVFCSGNILYNERLFLGSYNNVKFVKSFSGISVLSILLLIDKGVKYDIIKYMKSYKVFEYQDNTTLLMLKLKNKKASKRIYEILYKRYVCVSGKCVDRRLYPLKKGWDLTGVVLNVGSGHYLLRAGTNVILLSSYNIVKKEIQDLWKKILNSIK